MGRILSIASSERAGILERPVQEDSRNGVVAELDPPPLVEPGDAPAPQEDVLAPYRRGPVEQYPRHRRLTRGELPWLSAVKLSWGLEVSLLNISSTGMLVETTAKFTPGSETEFRLCGPDTSLVVPARFVRSEVAQVDTRSVKYHAAAVFAKELQLSKFLGPGGATCSMPQALSDLLTDVLTDVDLGGRQALLRPRFEKALRRMVSARDIQLRDGVVSRDGGESIYFSVPSVDGSRPILQATFEPGHVLSATEFRTLQSAATIAAVVLEFENIP